MPEKSRAAARDREQRSQDRQTPRRAGPRALWSGTLTFGLVSIPVELFPAIRSERPSLRMLDAKGRPLRRRYFCPRDQRPLDSGSIVRGYEIDEDRYIVVTDEELESLAPEQSRDIDLKEFVDRREIDPMLLERGYFLVPAGGSTKPYRLLARTMEDSGRAGIASFVMRGKAYLVTIFADDGILRAQTMRYHDELRSLDELELGELPRPSDAAVQEMRRAIEAIEAADVDPSELEDSQAQRIEALVERKRDAQEDVVAAPSAGEHRAPEAVVVDLMQVLKERLGGSEQAEAEGKG